MIWRIEVFNKTCIEDPVLLSEIKELGITHCRNVLAKKVYFIESHTLVSSDIKNIANKLLIDAPVENYALTQGVFSRKPEESEIVIMFNPGVFDTQAASLHRAIKDLSLDVEGVFSARCYAFEGLRRHEIKALAEKILYNPLIEHIINYEKLKDTESLKEFMNIQYRFKRIEIDILGASDNALMRISKEGNLSLTIPEMRLIKKYYRKRKRNPTDCELETIAQTWSEHCAHKTFRGTIHYEEKDASGVTLHTEKITNLLKSTVMKATKDIDSCACVSVFDDNSGIVTFDEDYNVCFKVETHNHPSSLEPYGGSSTGIGGVIRDVLGTGQSAKPIANIDVFCFSDWHLDYSALPTGLLHPKRIIKGVVRGVRDYGNRMGIPTIGGAVCFDERFLGNPLVYCGTVGILPKKKSFKEVNVGDLIIVCGARTGRDGIHGATFSSVELNEETVSLTSAVQIGNPIEEKKLVEALMRARDLDLFDAITDCGAGGLSSAVGEMAKDFGAVVHLEEVPLKYSGLAYTEIWISESQERMVIFSRKEHLKQLKAIFDEEEVEFAVIGEVTNDKKLILFYGEEKVAELDMDFLHDVPGREQKAVWIRKESSDKKLKEKLLYNDDLCELLSSFNIAPKDWIVREYDHEVQGASCVKPIVGGVHFGISDASVIRPDFKSKKALAIGIGINPGYSDIDPYWMGALAIDEALRNVTCVGAKLSQTFILDNFSWGSPNDEHLLGGLVRASKACYDFATYFGTPFISGKDSLYNEYVVGRKRIAIPGTLLISALSVLDDVGATIGSVFKRSKNLIYILGVTSNHLGASSYFRNKGVMGGHVPAIDIQSAHQVFDAVSAAIRAGEVASCHDCSEGGLAVALAEMCMGSGFGANIFLGEAPRNTPLLSYEVLFSESPSRFIVEVPKEKQELFQKRCKDLPFGLIGCVADDGKLIVYKDAKHPVIDVDIGVLRESWLLPFKEFRFTQTY